MLLLLCSFWDFHYVRNEEATSELQQSVCKSVLRHPFSDFHSHVVVIMFVPGFSQLCYFFMFTVMFLL